MRVLILLSLAAWTASAVPRQKVLVLLPAPPGRPMSNAVLDGIQVTLRAASPDIDLSVDYIVPNTLEQPGFEAAQTEWYRARYQDRMFDAILVFGLRAFEGLLRVRNQIWPDVPVVFCGVDSATYRQVGPQPNMTGTLSASDLRENLRIIRRLLPGTRRIALIGGASPGDRGFNAGAAEIIQEAKPPIEKIDLTRLPVDELKRRVAALPDGTVALVFSYQFDPEGQPVYVRDLVSALHAVSRVPIFEEHDFSMGAGNVGGLLTHYRQVGVEGARQALQILRGRKASEIPVIKPLVASLQFDWRELERWKIPLDRVPDTAEILYQPFSVWSRYGWWIAGGLAVLSLESLLIVVLLFLRSKAKQREAGRKQAELETQAIREEISHLNRIASMGELTASLAHELNQPLAGILANAAAAINFLDRSPSDLDEVAAALDDIREDDQRAAEIIRRMRRMLKKDKAQMALVDLNAVTRDAVTLLRTDANLRKVSLELDLAAQSPMVHGDAVQLQQVVMNLVLNAMEAMPEAATGSRLRRVIVRTSVPDAVELAVMDTGIGIPAEHLSRVFEPFFSTRAHGLGMGLSISRAIVSAHGGRIWAESRGPGRGSVFRVTLTPARQAEAA